MNLLTSTGRGSNLRHDIELVSIAKCRRRGHYELFSIFSIVYQYGVGLCCLLDGLKRLVKCVGHAFERGGTTRRTVKEEEEIESTVIRSDVSGERELWARHAISCVITAQRRSGERRLALVCKQSKASARGHRCNLAKSRLAFFFCEVELHVGEADYYLVSFRANAHWSLLSLCPLTL